MSRYNITGVGVYGIVVRMNPMMGNTENATEFGPFDDIEAAKRWYDSMKVERYAEDGPCMFNMGHQKTYQKSFRKGSELEMYNPLSEQEWEGLTSYGHGVVEVLIRVEQVIKNFKIG